MREDSHKKLFLYCKESIAEQTDPLEIAWRFYACNKCSFSGLGESSGFSNAASVSNFSEAGINKLIEYSRIIANWKITNEDYTALFKGAKKNTFMFLDPPYDIQSFLYGKNGAHHCDFDHYKFCEDVNKLKCNVMITYNSNDKLKDMYDDWVQTVWHLTYTMHSGAKYRGDEHNRMELLLRNYENESNDLEEFLS